MGTERRLPTVGGKLGQWGYCCPWGCSHNWTRRQAQSGKKKLSTLKQLDEEILDLVEEEAVDDEIAQVDAGKEKIYAATVDIDKHCTPVG